MSININNVLYKEIIKIIVFSVPILDPTSINKTISITGTKIKNMGIMYFNLIIF